MRTIGLVFAVLCAAGAGGCHADRGGGHPAQASDAAPIHCGELPKGWVVAKATTRDLAPPCQSGSTGICAEPGYAYVSGTGWCRPTGTPAG